MTNEEIEKALRQGYKQKDNVRRSPYVVGTVLLILIIVPTLAILI